MRRLRASFKQGEPFPGSEINPKTTCPRTLDGLRLRLIRGLNAEVEGLSSSGFTVWGV